MSSSTSNIRAGPCATLRLVGDRLRGGLMSIRDSSVMRTAGGDFAPYEVKDWLKSAETPDQGKIWADVVDARRGGGFKTS